MKEKEKEEKEEEKEKEERERKKREEEEEEREREREREEQDAKPAKFYIDIGHQKVITSTNLYLKLEVLRKRGLLNFTQVVKHSLIALKNIHTGKYFVKCRSAFQTNREAHVLH